MFTDIFIENSVENEKIEIKNFRFFRIKKNQLIILNLFPNSGNKWSIKAPKRRPTKIIWGMELLSKVFWKLRIPRTNAHTQAVPIPVEADIKTFLEAPLPAKPIIPARMMVPKNGSTKSAKNEPVITSNIFY